MHRIATRLSARCLLIIPVLLFLRLQPAAGQVPVESPLQIQQDYPVDSLVEKSISLLDTGAHDLAMYYLTLALPLCDTSDDRFCRPGILNLMGAAYLQKSDYSMAVKCFYTAIMETGAPDSTNIDRLITYYNNLAATFGNIKDPDRALYYLARAKELAIVLGDTMNLIYIFGNIAGMYGGKEQWDSCLHYYEQTLNILRAREQTPTTTALEGTVLLNLGDLYLRTDKNELARTHLEKANELVTSKVMKARVNMLLGEVYTKIGRYDIARQVLTEAVQGANDIGSKEELKNIYNILSYLYSLTGNFKDAYTTLYEASKLQDSIGGIEIARTTQQLEIQYRTAQRDKELAEKTLVVTLKDQQISKQRAMIFAVSGGVILLAIVLTGTTRHYRQARLLQDERIKVLEQSKEIALLKARIEGEEKERSRIAAVLHDGVGSMVSAAKMHFSTAHKDERDTEVNRKIVELLNEASTEIRNTAHNLMPSFLKEEGLDAAVEAFCRRVENNNALRIDYQYVGQRNIAPGPDVELLAYRAIQELLNNIIKYAGAGKAIVQVSIRDHLLMITVEDNGVGFDTTEDSKGSGLRNLRDHIRHSGGRMSVESQPGQGTQVYLEFDLQHHTQAAATA